MNKSTLTEEKKERELLHQDTSKHNDLLRRANTICHKITAIKDVWTGLKLGPFDNDAFKAVMYNLKAVRVRVMEARKKEYEALGIPSKAILEEILDDASTMVRDLYKAAELVNIEVNSGAGAPRFPLEAITIGADGLPEITGTDLLKDMSCVYLETPEEKELYRKLKGLELAFNEVQAEYEKIGYHGRLYGFVPMSQAFNLNSDKKATVNPEFVKQVILRYQK